MPESFLAVIYRHRHGNLIWQVPVGEYRFTVSVCLRCLYTDARTVIVHLPRLRVCRAAIIDIMRKVSARSTQPGHPFVGRRNEYQPKGDGALRLGSKGRRGTCAGGR